MKLTSLIDHTILAAGATAEQVKKLCSEAEQYNFASVCINSSRVALAKELLKDSTVKVCTVVGFPLGAMSSKAKAYEAKVAIQDGADEVDMVINVGLLKDQDYEGLFQDIKEVKEACQNTLLKVIIETCLLTDEEKVIACEAAVKAGADYVKTSTGFSTGGAKVEDIALMRKTVGPDIGVKASGGIRDKETAQAMVDNGATRLGCSSGVQIAQGLESSSAY